jgi:hypothetical protein
MKHGGSIPGIRESHELVTMSVDEARDLMDTLPEELAGAFDEAQGPVFSGDESVSFIVIKIKGNAT